MSLGLELLSEASSFKFGGDYYREQEDVFKGSQNEAKLCKAKHLLCVRPHVGTTAGGEFVLLGSQT